MKLSATFLPQSITPRIEPQKIDASTGTPVVRELVDHPVYDGPVSVTPSGAEQTLSTDGYLLDSDITVSAIPSDYIGSDVPRKDSTDLSASGATVTAPAGYYESPASKSVQSGSATTPALNLEANPNIVITNSGKITSSVSLSESITPIVQEGYVSSGTAGTVTVAGNQTLQLATKDATTITPTESVQTAVEQNKWTTGVVKVGAIPSDYIGSGVPSKTSSDLSASGATVTAPSGYYAADASKTIPDATISTSGTFTINPILSVDYATGVITSSINSHPALPAIQTAGYITPSTVFPFTVTGNSETQLITKSSDDLTVSGSTVTAPSGYYPSAASKAVPYRWMGDSAELVQSYTTESALLSATDFNTWTPSTTAFDIVASTALGTQSIDTENYEYILNWKFFIDPIYDGTQTNKARVVKAAQDMFYYIVRRPSNLTNIASGMNNYNVAINVNTPGILDYYNSSSSHTLTWSVSYGIYMTAVAPTFASNTNYATTLTINRPKITARCSTTYLSTSNCGKIKKAETKYFLKATLWRCKPGSYPFSIYQDVISLYNNGL